MIQRSLIYFLLGTSLVLPMLANSAVFSIVVMTDSQFYVERHPEILEAQIDWIVANQATENIIYVAQTGDIKDDGLCDDKTVNVGTGAGRTEWQIADDAYVDLDTAKIPYGVLPGNHDFDPVGPAPGACPFGPGGPLTQYNARFGPARFAGELFYGDPLAVTPGNRVTGSNEDNFTLFDSDGVRFIAINLAYRPDLNEAPLNTPPDRLRDNPELAWADNLLKTYPDRLGIVTSHYFMETNSATSDNELGLYGQAVYDVLSNNRNLFMMLAGHWWGEAWRSEDAGRASTGFPPTQILMANYQGYEFPDDGDPGTPANTPNPALIDFSSLPSFRAGAGATDAGFMRIMRFDTDTGMVDIETFIPPVVPVKNRTGTLVSTYFPASGAGMSEFTASNLSFSFQRYVTLADLFFPDVNLRNCILNSGVTYVSELTRLSCRGTQISDLTGIGNLIALTSLDLQRNQITSLPPDIRNLTALSVFILNDNLLTSLPPEIGNLTSLTQLYLNDNQLTSLPPEIGNLTALAVLDLFDNQLTSLPAEIWDLTALSALDLIDNQLTILSAEIGNLTALRSLRLDENRLTSLPAEIGNLTALSLLTLNLNQLTSLPPEIGNLTALSVLTLNLNQLTSLPPEIGNLTRLNTLDLSSNRLTSLPPEIGNLTALSALILSANQLTSLPPEIGSLTSLDRINLDDNQLTGLPPEIRNLTGLTTLDLTSNQLASLPPEIGNLTALSVLSLTDNQITSLPPEIGNLTALGFLLLDGNQLTILPTEIGNLTALFVLDLNDNQLTSLPAEIGNLAALRILDLTNNNNIPCADIENIIDLLGQGIVIEPSSCIP